MEGRRAIADSITFCLYSFSIFVSFFKFHFSSNTLHLWLSSPLNLFSLVAGTFAFSTLLVLATGRIQSSSSVGNKIASRLKVELSPDIVCTLPFLHFDGLVGLMFCT